MTSIVRSGYTQEVSRGDCFRNSVAVFGVVFAILRAPLALAGASLPGVACSITTENKVSLSAHSCVNGWARDGYKGWGRLPGRSGDGYGHVRIKLNEQGTFKVLKVNRDRRMVQIEVPPGSIDGKAGESSSTVPLWVNAGSLQCAGGGPVTPSSDGAGDSLPGHCPRPGSLPIDVAPIAEAVETVNSNLTHKFFERADEYVRATQSKVSEDNLALAGPYEQADPKRRKAILEAARSKLEKSYLQLTLFYGPRCSCDPADWVGHEKTDYALQTAASDPKRPPAELICQSAEGRERNEPDKVTQREQMERSCRSVRDAVDLLHGLGTGDAAVAAFDHEVAAARGAHKPDNQQISVRMALLYGMDLDGKDLAASGAKPKLNFYRRVGNGPLLVPEVHNGYFLNSGRSTGTGSAQDCGGFAMAQMYGMTRSDGPGTHTRSVPSVDDFNALHDMIGGGASSDRMKDYAACFKVVDVLAGETLVPGDLVSSTGHIVLVKSYDAANKRIETIEARSGNFGTIGYGSLPLTEPDCSGTTPDTSVEWRNRPVRSDLRVLRYTGGIGCKISSVGL